MKELEDQLAMIEAGLIQCCVKALYYLYARTTPYNTKTEDSIADTLASIGNISLKSVGHINVSEFFNIISIATLSFKNNRKCRVHFLWNVQIFNLRNGIMWFSQSIFVYLLILGLILDYNPNKTKVIVYAI